MHTYTVESQFTNSVYSWTKLVNKQIARTNINAWVQLIHFLHISVVKLLLNRLRTSVIFILDYTSYSEIS